MLPNKWTYTFDKPTETISWLRNKEFTFQANCAFPAPRHNYLPYFEVFVTGIVDHGTIAIGVGTAEITGKDILPGWKPGSYGYHADDGYIYLQAGEGSKYGPTYATGDVVGCGITINNELYFTKNGQKLGIACTLPKTKLFPIVGLDHASISTNFGHSPFMYNPFTNCATPSQVVETAACLLAQTENTVLHILSFLSPAVVTKFASTSRSFFRLARRNEIWKPLVFQKWITVSPNVPIPSFYEFYKRRLTQQKTKIDDVLIENCMDWEFLCPATISKFTRTVDSNVDHCSVCKKDVYFVHNMEQLNQRVSNNQCVAIDFDNKVSKSRAPRAVVMGRVRRT